MKCNKQLTIIYERSKVHRCWMLCSVNVMLDWSRVQSPHWSKVKDLKKIRHTYTKEVILSLIHRDSTTPSSLEGVQNEPYINGWHCHYVRVLRSLKFCHVSIWWSIFYSICVQLNANILNWSLLSLDLCYLISSQFT